MYGYMHISVFPFSFVGYHSIAPIFVHTRSLPPTGVDHEFSVRAGLHLRFETVFVVKNGVSQLIDTDIWSNIVLV
jgi:hypothetical protein